MLKAPDFWRRDSLSSRVLSPLGWLFDLGVGVRLGRGRGGFDPGVPVLCVGNLVLGGAGKTPLCMTLAGMLRARGRWPHILARGYGGSLTGPVRIDPDLHDAASVGDEPLLLTQAAPTWIGRDRIASARLAVAAGADCLILDDGFQDPSLSKTCSLVVLDGGYGLGNGRVFPAGPLRETPRRGFARADACVLVGEDRVGIEARLPTGMPVFRARLLADPLPGGGVDHGPVLAFAGIGRPEKFFDTLRAIGAQLAGTQEFPDHHPYTVQDLEGLAHRAKDAGARLITTAKDGVRLPQGWLGRVDILPVALHPDDPDGMANWLLRSLTPR